MFVGDTAKYVGKYLVGTVSVLREENKEREIGQIRQADLGLLATSPVEENMNMKLLTRAARFWTMVISSSLGLSITCLLPAMTQSTIA